MDVFSKYLVSCETGFLINQRKIIEMPSYYDPWITLKLKLEDLMNSECLWDYVNELPFLSIDFLTSTEQLLYSHSILAMATSAYVWHKRSIEIPKLLPKSISVPLRRISEKVGLMPILCHCDLVLANTMIDKTKDILDKNCLVIKETIVNNNNWNIFQRETARIELIFAPIIMTIRDLRESILNVDVDSVILSLKTIITTINDISKAMNFFNEMDPDYFHTKMRPFLTGWNGDSFPQKGGLLYENEDGSTTQLEYIGGSAGQSPTLQVLDTLFKINHYTESKSFLDTMKHYMIKQHRDFITDLSNFVNLQDYIQNNKEHKVLVETYNECLSSISSYRTRHMLTVTKFIINPAKRVAKEENNYQFLQERGTGGQKLLEFLAEVRNDTNDAKVLITK